VAISFFFSLSSGLFGDKTSDSKFPLNLKSSTHRYYIGAILLSQDSFYFPSCFRVIVTESEIEEKGNRCRLETMEKCKTLHPSSVCVTV
jgi:hypothetical protein